VAGVGGHVKKLVALGAEVMIETGPATSSAVPDGAYARPARASRSMRPEWPQGCRCRAEGAAPADPGRRRPGRAGAHEVRRHAHGHPRALCAKDQVAAYAAQGVNAFAMEFLPRITRAQTMDVLSSQANLAGYRAVIEAAAVFGRAFR